MPNQALGRSRLRPRAVPAQTNPRDRVGRAAQAHGEQTKPMAAAGGRWFGHCLDERSQFRGPYRHPGRRQTPAAPLCGVTQQDRTAKEKREEAVQGAAAYRDRFHWAFSGWQRQAKSSELADGSLALVEPSAKRVRCHPESKEDFFQACGSGACLLPVIAATVCRPHPVQGAGRWGPSHVP